MKRGEFLKSLIAIPAIPEIAASLQELKPGIGGTAFKFRLSADWWHGEERPFIIRTGEEGFRLWNEALDKHLKTINEERTVS